MIDPSIFLSAMREYGRTRALALREAAPNLTDTEIIERELFIPEWKEGAYIAGAVVRRSELDQDYRVLQDHDSTGNPTWTPENSPALFGVCHTTNPEKAKAWVEPLGTSGMYYLNECYRDENGVVWRQVYDGGNVYNAATLPERWEVVK